MGSDAPYSLGEAECIRESEKGLLVDLIDAGATDDEPVWIPKSAVHDDSEVYDEDENSVGELIVKHWWAEKEGWT